MRIEFRYTNGEVTERAGTLLGLSNGGTPLTRELMYALVQEDGADNPKSFRLDRMDRVRTVAREDGEAPVRVRTDEELMPLVRAAAGDVLNRIRRAGKDFKGNPLELLLAVEYSLVGEPEAIAAHDDVTDAVEYFETESETTT